MFVKGSFLKVCCFKVLKKDILRNLCRIFNSKEPGYTISTLTTGIFTLKSALRF
ncbi:hypothetical protein DFR59_12333 [Falsibacillus pallidus]|uniref:Uncharacterized protein n=1 Tax=Falsibacillus pallidus TaxID=493781 RepID=A0A370G1T7_9BACI|nr:hypothetical protein DFR59_12333 [Falsibacillus pallidus]